MRVTLSPPSPERPLYPDNTIHWSNTDVMLGHRRRRFLNTQYSNVIFDFNCFPEMSTGSPTRHPSFSETGHKHLIGSKSLVYVSFQCVF